MTCWISIIPFLTAQVLTIHQYRLCDIVRIVTSDNVINPQLSRTSIESLSPEHTTERAVVLPPDLAHDFVHRPAVQLII